MKGAARRREWARPLNRRLGHINPAGASVILHACPAGFHMGIVSRSAYSAPCGSALYPRVCPRLS